MRRLPLLSTPPSISIADEPLDHGLPAREAATLAATDGFELVPAWQARSPRRLRSLRAALPLVAVAVAAALWLGRDHEAQALRERSSAASAARPARTHALVVRATLASRATAERSRP